MYILSFQSNTLTQHTIVILSNELNFYYISHIRYDLTKARVTYIDRYSEFYHVSPVKSENSTNHWDYCKDLRQVSWITAVLRLAPAMDALILFWLYGSAFFLPKLGIKQQFGMSAFSFRKTINKYTTRQEVSSSITHGAVSSIGIWLVAHLNWLLG